MIAGLLIVAFILVIGTTARLTRLVTDDVITQPARDRLTAGLKQLSPAHKQHDTDWAQYEALVQSALDNHQPLPEPPTPPDEPRMVTLLTCRWCAGLWLSLAVVVIARIAMTGEFLPLWTGLPLAPVDFLLVPAATLTTSYAVGWLADHE